MTATPIRSDRRGMLASMGAAILGAVAATTINAKRADAHAPTGCYGLNDCVHHGYPVSCSGSPQGSCCWIYIDEVACKAYKCCDRNTSEGWCICRYYIGSFC